MDTPTTSNVAYSPHFDIAQTAPGQIKVIRRNGTVTPFDANKIAVAMTKAFLAVEGDTAAGSSRIHEKVASLSQKIADTFHRRFKSGGTINIEQIQDQVELELMRTGEYKAAKAYVLYREERRRAREEEQNAADSKKASSTLHVTMPNGSIAPLDINALTKQIEKACKGLENVTAQMIIDDAKRNLFDKVPVREVHKALVMSSRILIEKEPNYTYVTARLLLDELQQEAMQFLNLQTNADFSTYFQAYLKRGIELELLDPRLMSGFNLSTLCAAMKPERDMQFTYLGLQTLYDRYFIHSEGHRFELPQAFFMRVAMGLAIEEKEKEKRAIEFYTLLSSFDFMS
jgi:ribonucleoside-diphosphate reductase alpha chain